MLFISQWLKFAQHSFLGCLLSIFWNQVMEYQEGDLIWRQQEWNINKIHKKSVPSIAQWLNFAQQRLLQATDHYAWFKLSSIKMEILIRDQYVNNWIHSHKIRTIHRTMTEFCSTRLAEKFLWSLMHILE